MRAIRIHQYGGPEVMQLEQIHRPVPSDDELLISIHAAGVNPVDLKIRQGEFPIYRPTLPITLGRDVAGVVEKVGRHVKGWLEGEPVFGMLNYERGAYAEYAVASPDEVARKPSKLDPVRAAGVPVAALTAWQALFEQGEIQAGQRVLIHGGAGGVGHFAIQFAAHAGAEVLTTASGKDQVFLRELGARQVIDYKAERFEHVLRDIDLVLDLVGGETRERSWAVLREKGRLVSTLGKPVVPPQAPRGAEGRGVVVKCRPGQLDEIGRLIDQGRVTLKVSKVFPLEESASAHEFLEHGHEPGKVVLAMT